MNHCDECGYVYDTPRELIADRFGELAARYVDALAAHPDDALRAHVRAGVWSALEYCCHLRDVLRVQRERIDLALAHDQPTFASMRREERVTEERYNDQSPGRVGVEITQAADELAIKLRSLDAAGWSRSGVYNWPVTEPRTVEWIGNHTIHECVHHLMDIDRLLFGE